MTQPKRKTNIANAWAEARELVWAHRGRLALGLALMLVSRLAGLVLPASSKILIDDVIGNGRADLLVPLALAAGAATIVDAATTFSLSQVLGVAAQRAIADMRMSVQQHIIRLPTSYFDSTQTGVLISRVMNDADGIRNLVEVLKLDVLLIDTHPGLNEETLLSIATSDALIVLMRPDQQDFQGTRVTVEVARKLGIERMVLVVNKTSSIFDPAAVKEEVAGKYKIDVAAVLPHSDEMMNLGSATIFAMRYPQHPITAAIKRTVDMLVS